MPQSRSGGTATGIATAIMALMAVATTAGAVPSPAFAMEYRSAASDSQAVRAVAAAVAAVARDLLGLDQSESVRSSPIADPVDPASQRPNAAAIPTSRRTATPPLRDALLNIPPPVW